MQKTCILCGEPLNKYPTNREHYVPQVLIREFNKLCIPSSFDWAMRVNQYNTLNTEKIVVPRSQHKTWAVVEVHQKCNQDASGMCQDLRYIIDHIDGDIPKHYFKRPIEYYAHIWHNNPSDVTFSILSPKDAEEERKRHWQGNDAMKLYEPGLLACGRILIKSEVVDSMHDFEKHSIFLGTKKAFS